MRTSASMSGLAPTGDAGEDDGFLSAQRLVLLVIAVPTAIRLGLAAGTGLGVDESYWASLARAPSLSYVDDAPMQAWLVAAARWLSASEATLALRLPFIMLFAGSSWLMFRLTRQFFGARAGLWAVVAFNLTPVFTLADAAWILPDGPLIFFTLATANVLARILFHEGGGEHRMTLWWAAAGVLGGLALLSKYHGIFLFLGTLLFLLTVPAQRRTLLTAGPWLGAAAALVVFAPVIVWNMQHDWVGLAFQLDRVGAAAADNTVEFDRDGAGGATHSTGALRMLGGSVLYLGWLVVPLGVVLVRALWRGPHHPTSWFLAMLAAGPIVVFGSVSVWANQQFPHWPMPGWLLVFPLLGALWAALEMRRPAVARGGMAAWAVVLLGFIAVVVSHIHFDTPNFAALNLPLRSDPTVELKDWDELRAAFARNTPAGGGEPVVAASHWMDAAKVAYALGPGVSVICVCRVPQHFPYLRDPADFAGRNIIVVGNRLSERRLQWLAGHFKSLEPLEPVPLYRAGVVVKTLMLYRGTEFDATGAHLQKVAGNRQGSPQRPIPRSSSEGHVTCQASARHGGEQACWPD